MNHAFLPPSRPRTFAVACALVLLATTRPPAEAANVTYTLSGVVTQAQWVGTSPHSGVVVGAPITGSFVIDDAAYSYPFATQRIYSQGMPDFRFTAGDYTYSMDLVKALIPFSTSNSNLDIRDLDLWDGYAYTAYGRSEDRFRTDYFRQNGQYGQVIRTSRIALELSSTSALGTNPTALNTLNLPGLDIDPLAFNNVREVWFRDSTLTWVGPYSARETYLAEVKGSVTSIRRTTGLAAVSSGTVAVPSGQQYNITTASGGVIDANAGVAQVGTLAGATLNTGSAGATITTLTSGTIVTNGGSVTAQGGTFTGQITGNGGLTKTGTGTLILNSANSFTGGTVIDAGIVEIAVGDALGSGTAPIRIANNGKFKAVAGVTVTKPVVISGTSAVYEHVLGASDSLTNLAPISNRVTTADIVAGDAVASGTTFTSNFNGNGSISLHGLNGTNFLMVLDMKGYVPENPTYDTCYLGWWDATANSGTGGWVKAVFGNTGSAGVLAGGYAMSYQKFLDDNGGWNSATMLGAYGLDVANEQVWAVINHNSDFGVTSQGMIIVPEPAAVSLGIAGVFGIGIWLERRRRKLAGDRSA